MDIRRIAFRPFCSERCKMIDLGAWATESYRMPVAEIERRVRRRWRRTNRPGEVPVRLDVPNSWNFEREP